MVGLYYAVFGNNWPFLLFCKYFNTPVINADRIFELLSVFDDAFALHV